MSRDVCLEDVNGEQILPITRANNVFVGEGVTLDEYLDNLQLGGGSGGSGGGTSVIVDAELSVTSKNPVQNKVITEKLNEVFQSVSNGKELLASAITDIGIDVEPDATFSEMAEIIRGLANRPIETFRSDIFNSQEESEGYVIYSSYCEGREPYKAFDDSTSTIWSTRDISNMDGEYLGYNFKEKKFIQTMTLAVAVDQDNLSFIIQGCEDTELTDNSVWEDLSEVITLPRKQIITSYSYNIKSDKAYSAYRILFKNGVQSWNTGAGVYEMVLTGFKYA